ncbi:MAG TPA: DUF533 domain-containing protein [Albidovulum sp.]|uniref:DUF533 domain-containing protein n=1 Tax=Albidovulum sp. TaxID=1872424 RepID=UPI002C473A8C|nr:DUF533 domain-containing protein [Albidovulum sp.]
MSFVRTLATLAMGFAAAKGFDKYRKMGGMDGVQDALRKAGEPGGITDQIGDMAEKMGVPGGRDAVRDMMGKYGKAAADASEAGQAGLGNLISAMTTAATAGSKHMTDMMGAVVGGTPVNAAMEENARLMIRAMIQAAKADGEIDAEERAKIMDHLKDASDEEIAFVEAELSAPGDVMALASAAGDGAKAQVYAAARMAIRVDNPQENAYLNQLATALGLDAETRARLDSGMA